MVVDEGPVLVESETKHKILHKNIEKRELEPTFFTKMRQENDCFAHGRTGHIFLEGQTPYCLTLRGGGRASMVGAERENFEDLEPLDCRNYSICNSIY